jgi:hypothetical protein
MDFLGDIIATPDPPGVDLERWKQVIAGHPNLTLAAPVVGINPSRKGRSPTIRIPERRGCGSAAPMWG